jgi:hypothetical protein
MIHRGRLLRNHFVEEEQRIVTRVWGEEKFSANILAAFFSSRCESENSLGQIGSSFLNKDSKKPCIKCVSTVVGAHLYLNLNAGVRQRVRVRTDTAITITTYIPSNLPLVSRKELYCGKLK